MKRNVRLIDLSWFSGTVIALACLSLISTAAGLAATSENPIEMLVMILIGMLPSIAAFWYFWWKSPVLSDQGVTQGKKHIPKSMLHYEMFYDTRYRETVICFYDQSKPYERADRKCPNRITVQATKRNQKLLETWLASISDDANHTER